MASQPNERAVENFEAAIKVLNHTLLELSPFTDGESLIRRLDEVHADTRRKDVKK